MRLVHGLHSDNLRGDIFGGVTAAVVALPLALAFGVASGAGPVAGLYGAIFVGFFAALFGGTPSQVSGPTGPMTVVMASVITQYAHEPALAFTVVMMGGAFQVLFGLLRLGSLISLVPFTVISGFMSGIGCIIIILQLAPLVGAATPPGGVLAAVLALPETLAGINPAAAAVGTGAFAVVILTPPRISKILPSPLIALIGGTLAVWALFPGAPVLGDIPTGLPEPTLPAFELAALDDMIVSALILGLLGAIDSLLTSLVADSITRSHHESDRELIGQGIANMIAGLFGAIPGAGATMRTVINVRTGGRTPLSGMIHALVLLAVVLALGPLAGLIPHAVLAGILIKVGIDIIDWGYLRRVPRAPRAGVVVMLLVLGLTVFVDLIMAVTVGIVVASLLTVKRMTELQLASIRSADGSLGELPLSPEEKAMLERHSDTVLLYHFGGAMSFGAAKGLTRRLQISEHLRALVLDMSDVTMIDTSVAFAIEDTIVRARGYGADVYLVGLRAPVETVLRRLGILDSLTADHCPATRIAALERAVHAISETKQVV